MGRSTRIVHPIQGEFVMDHAQREQSPLQILQAFTKGLTALKEAIALVHSANDQLPAGEPR
ncbi:MAG: hypothetical protein MRJ67_00475 [Nitrospirales bacterium]|nr:hypothetical protein [Nitrospirales bacterium]MDR4483778.1 hypothetical protein [Nitrospirales bacterium]